MLRLNHIAEMGFLYKSVQYFCSCPLCVLVVWFRECSTLISMDVSTFKILSNFKNMVKSNFKILSNQNDLVLINYWFFALFHAMSSIIFSLEYYWSVHLVGSMINVVTKLLLIDEVVRLVNHGVWNETYFLTSF